MPTPPIIKLTKGRRELNLVSIGTSGRYNADKFVPPDVNISALIAEGTSANRRNGGRKVGERALDREITLNIQIKNCGSEAEVNRALRDLRNFLSLAGDESEPLYLEFRPNNSVAAEPLWGNYGMNFRYEIIHASRVSVTDDYWLIWQDQGELPVSPITLTIKPYALGLKQRLASALGGVYQDLLGVTDGISRGPILAPAVTNIHNNPVFGNSTYNTNWTAGSNLVVSQNVDPMYLLNDTINSAYIVSRNTTNNTFTQSLTLTAVAHNLFYLIMLPDGGTPSSSDVEITYNSITQTTTFVNLGNGLWRITASVTGTGGAAATGVIVKSGRAIYLLFAQAATGTSSNIFVPTWGDQLGCTWTGGAHASTSTRPAARIRIPVAVDTFNLAQGTIIIPWKSIVTSNWPVDEYLFSCGATNLRARFESSDDKFYFSDNTNEISTAAQTFSSMDIIWLAFVWGPNGLAIYKNGVLAASGATYSPPALPSYIYIGTDDSAANSAFGPFMDFRIYNDELTAAEILADYTNGVQITNDNQRIGTIPYLWTKDGDDVVDNGDTSAKDFFAVCDGIPGSVEAETEISIQSSSSSAVPLNISRWETEYFMTPSDLMFKDEGGTVDANANNGDSAVRGPLGTTGTAIVSFTAMKAIQYKLLAEKEVFIFTRIADAGSNLMLALELQLSSSVILTDYYSVSSNASARLLRTPSLVLPSLDSVGLMNNITPNSGFLLALFGKRSTGSANYTIDYGAVFPRPLAIISPNNAGTGTIFILKGGRCLIVDASNNTYIQEKSILGDEIELVPGMVNNLLTLLGDSTFNPDVTLTLTYNRVDITPRWSLA